MEILFRTKEESNKQQWEDFLELSPGQRFTRFLEMGEAFDMFPVKKIKEEEKAAAERKKNQLFTLKTTEVIGKWKEKTNQFIFLANKHKVRMLLVGGGAVNFHGYQRHSADVDFWIDTTEENFQKLLVVFKEMGYEIEDFPEDVKNRFQNISLKFSPADFNIELITRFSINKTFEEAWSSSETVELNKFKVSKINVLNITDLIDSKIKSGRPKDLLDVQQLKEIHDLN